MIKLLRKVRQNLLSEGKTRKYLKYAIGEIVLVVIGILIALQVNNWNESKKNAKWEQQFLNDLRNELNNDFNQLNNVYLIQKKKGLACKTLLELIDNGNKGKKSEIDSIFASIQSVNPTFFPTTGVYDSGLAAGKLELIKNDSLKYMITNLYNHYYRRLVYNGEILDNVVEKVDWEKGKFYDSKLKQITSWEAALSHEFKNQILFLKDQNEVYHKLAKTNLEQIEIVSSLVSKIIDENN